MTMIKKIALGIALLVVLAGVLWHWFLMRATLLVEIVTDKPAEYLRIDASNQVWGHSGFSGGYDERLFVRSGKEYSILSMSTFSGHDALRVSVTHPMYAINVGGVRLRRMPGNKIRAVLVDDIVDTCTGGEKFNCVSIPRSSRVIDNGGTVKLVFYMTDLEKYLDRAIAETTDEDFARNFSQFKLDNYRYRHYETAVGLSRREMRAIKVHNYSPEREWGFYFYTAKKELGINLVERYSGFLSDYCFKYEAIPIAECAKDTVVRVYNDDAKRWEREK